jgi:cytidylate kinase
MSRPISSLAPDIERRLAGWVKIQERNIPPAEVRICPTITLSRQFGCEGFLVAERLKTLFEEASGEPWNIFDKSLIELVAKEEDIPLSLLKRLGDMSRAVEAFGLHSAEHVTHDMAFDKVSRYLVQIARLGNAIVVGRGSAILCKSLKNCFHFRLIGGHDWRVATFARRTGLSREEAEVQVKECERQREKFVTQCLGEDITDPRFYDAIFNNERRSVEEVSQAILACVRQAWEDKRYFRKG